MRNDEIFLIKASRIQIYFKIGRSGVIKDYKIRWEALDLAGVTHIEVGTGFVFIFLSGPPHQVRDFVHPGVGSLHWLPCCPITVAYINTALQSSTVSLSASSALLLSSHYKPGHEAGLLVREV